MQETQVRSLDWEDRLVKGMTTHSSFAGRIPGTEEPGGLYSPWGHKESDPTEQLIHNAQLSKLYNIWYTNAIFSSKLFTIGVCKR